MGNAEFGREGDPFFNLDHFRMAGPTFPPHPHAGFSAVTYVLPESPLGMVNRDSRGDRSSIEPGGMHWTMAGSGIVHEEVPAAAGTVEGMQIFIRQPTAQETMPPRVCRVEADDVPVAALENGGWLRVLAGRYGTLAAPFEPPSPLVLLDISLAPGSSFVWPDPGTDAVGTSWRLAAYVFRGSLRRDEAPALAMFSAASGPVTLVAGGNGARLLLMSGAPLHQPSVSGGPFALSSQAAIDDAFARYRAGAMGRLDP